MKAALYLRVSTDKQELESGGRVGGQKVAPRLRCAGAVWQSRSDCLVPMYPGILRGLKSIFRSRSCLNKPLPLISFQHLNMRRIGDIFSA